MKRLEQYGQSLMKFLLVAGMAGLSAPAPAEETNGVSRQEVQRLLGDMGHAKYAVRNAAQQELLAVSSNQSDVVLNEGLKLYASIPDPEVTSRLREVLFDIFLNRERVKSPGFLGIQMGSVQTTGPKGDLRQTVSVLSVVPATAAAKGGIKAGDLILTIDDLDVNKNPSLQDFFWHVRSRNAGDTAKLSIKRGSDFMDLSITLGDVPANERPDPEQVEADRKRDFEEWLGERLNEEQKKARR